MQTTTKSLGIFSLAMLSVIGIIDLRGLPLMASYGYASAFFYLVAAIGFLLPSALVCAELSTKFPQAGGIYLWIREAFGPSIGFTGMWLEWINNVISAPVTLSFLATAIAYLIDPTWIENKKFLFPLMMVLLWSATFFNFLGIRIANWLTIGGALLGTLLPAAIIILLSINWLKQGHQSQINFTWYHLFPAWNISNLVVLVSVLSGYAGMQITAFHVQDVKHPRQDFPKAILIAFIIILMVTLFGTLSLAMVVPANKISLLAGLFQGFTIFFNELQLPHAIKLLVVMLLLAGFSSLCAWLLGPARGLQNAASRGDFPALFAKTNKLNIPVNILLLQGLLVSLLSSAFYIMPTINSAFWFLLVLTSQFTLMMNILMFAAVIKLRQRPSNEQSFKIPGGKFGLYITSGTAMLICFLAIVMSFIPPQKIAFPSQLLFGLLILGSDLLYLVIPIIIYYYLQKRKLACKT